MKTILYLLVGLLCCGAKLRINFQGSSDGRNWTDTGSSWTINGISNPIVANRFYAVNVSPLQSPAPPDGYIYVKVIVCDGGEPGNFTNILHTIPLWAIPTTHGRNIRAHLTLIP